MKDKVIIIAEAGVNHNGDIKRAKALIDAACDAGVDYVKFQTFKAAKTASVKAKKAEYQHDSLDGTDDFQYNMLKQLELSHESHLDLMQYCKEKGIHFFSTAFDTEGIDYLDSLGFEMFKIPSGEITNYPYLKLISKKAKPVILSTGMSSIEEIDSALMVLLEQGLAKEDITVLHCNTDYPTPMQDVNLRAMLDIQHRFGVKIGYSDHTLGIEVPTAAVALGASVIEKHFTLDRNLPGPDHKASLEPNELKAMVKSIRNVEIALSGSGKKEPSESEKKNVVIARKSIHIRNTLHKNQVVKEEDLIPLRPGDGISPFHWNEIIGKKVARDLQEYHKLVWNDLL